MKRILIIAMMLLLTGCTVEINVNEVEEYWDEIDGVEYVNFDVFAGHALYFYEEDGVPYVDYMRYGSGVPVILRKTSEIEFDGNKMYVSFNAYIGDRETTGDQVTFTSDTTLDYTLEYSDGNIVLNDMVFVETDIPCHDGC